MSALPQSTLLRKDLLNTLWVDPTVCWQALRSRDPRFDGKCFAGVVTTRIYCRTICPIPLNKPENIRWFATAADAESAGFRSCRRCNPQISPHAPAWRGTGAVVSRALKLILDGDLDSSKVGELAGRVGMGPRHLRRLFVQHVGASPLKIAQTRRAYAANRLVTETNLPFADIAYRAGFKSVRQFNEVILATFGAAPSQLRDTKTNLSPDGGIEVHLSYRPPMDWTALMTFLGQRATPGVEKVEHDCYQRTIEVDGDIGELEVKRDDTRPRIKVRVKLLRHTHLVKVVERVRRMFDVGADPIQIANHLSGDLRLQHLVRSQPGLRIPGAWQGFEVAVKAILGERLTTAAPAEVVARLVGAFGQQIRSGSDLSHLFPTPAVLAEADLALLGIRGVRAIGIRTLAEVVCSSQIDFEASCDRSEIFSRLKRIQGMDEVAISYIAMRAFAEPDAFSLSPRELGFSGPRDSWAKFLATTERWRPWRSYTALHLSRAEIKA